MVGRLIHLKSTIALCVGIELMNIKILNKNNNLSQGDVALIIFTK